MSTLSAIFELGSEVNELRKTIRQIHEREDIKRILDDERNPPNANLGADDEPTPRRRER
jgi:hypothetical protein